MDKELEYWEHVNAKLDVLDELARFQTDRKLDKKEFNKDSCVKNILEEIFELYGLKDETEDRVTVGYALKYLHLIIEYAKHWRNIEYEEPTEEEEVDALCDIQVFAGGDVMKLGYDNKKCLLEVSKEINSREGEFIEGKFQKYKTKEAIAKWYKADFSGCKL